MRKKLRGRRSAEDGERRRWGRLRISRKVLTHTTHMSHVTRHASAYSLQLKIKRIERIHEPRHQLFLLLLFFSSFLLTELLISFSFQLLLLLLLLILILNAEISGKRQPDDAPPEQRLCIKESGEVLLAIASWMSSTPDESKTYLIQMMP